MCGQAFRWSPAQVIAGGLDGGMGAGRAMGAGVARDGAAKEGGRRGRAKEDARHGGAHKGGGYLPAEPTAFIGVVAGSLIRLEQSGRRLSVRATSERVDRRFVRLYLGLDDGLEARYRRLRRGDPVMRAAVGAGRGMRLMRQDVWECLASFILSSASNIPRIRRCVESVAREYGRRLLPGRAGRLDATGAGSNAAIEPAWRTAPGEPLSPWAFPRPRDIVEGGRRCMRGCRLGFREFYLWETARRFADSGTNPDALRAMEPGEARAFLLTLPGVGPKVADCVSLFSLGHGRTFPTDVWIRKAVRDLYLGGRPATARQVREWGLKRWGEDAGYAQQYLYYHARGRTGMYARVGRGGMG